MKKEQIKHMVDRFLMWKLPDNFNPDGGISFERTRNAGTPYEFKSEPVGTNLLDADQAAAMVRHMVEGLPMANRDLRELLATCRHRIKAQTDVGLISQDPENEDPQHEFQELLPDLDAALGLSD